eukprot:TRINITY_DN6908_c0_g1_i1.p1 TRINITY_DN6908_c0_g1~~TRINITY_DN6908_c0_g1_i1.p1  ORF type:complete len:129 (+),score=16.17 TRINITY_DN6908_c0_g1_i1:347-733(+)
MMNSIYLSATVVAFMACCVSSDIAQVKYLGGITFLLKDRCPEYASDFEIDNYKQCAENEILHTQCTTDRLLTGDKLTVPLFTDICSAVCWGEDVKKIHDCPYNGRRLDGKGKPGSARVDQGLADRFLG